MSRALLTRSLSIVVCCIGVALAFERADARRKPPPPSTGLAPVAFAQAPPDFAYRTPSGVRRLHDLVGTPVVVNFWATWCHPCEAELATFARLRAAYGSRVPVLAISAEAPGVARAFLEARHIDATAVDDDEHRIADLYGVSAIPVTLVVARDGTVAHVSIGQIDWPELQDAIAALPPAAAPDLTPQGKSSTLQGNAGTPTP